MQSGRARRKGFSIAVFIMAAAFVCALGAPGTAVALTWSDTSHGNQTTGVDHSGSGYDIGDCAQCHDLFDPSLCDDVAGLHLFAAEEALCFDGSCHPNVGSQYNASTDTFIGYGTSYNKVNTKHDVLDSDQAYSGAVMECKNCHNVTHKVRSVVANTAAGLYSNLINPDTGSPFTTTMTHPGTGSLMLNITTFCETCHDGGLPAGVTGPTDPLLDIKTIWSHTKTGKRHGAAAGGLVSGHLTGPYSGKVSPVAVMPCTDCHDSHAGGGLYHLKTLTGYWGPFTITKANIATDQVSWCTACHYYPLWQPEHSVKVECLSCHKHTDKW